MKILYDASPLLLRSAGVKNYHYSLLKELAPIIAPHSLRLFPDLKDLTPNNNEKSNYPAIATAIRLGRIRASNRFHLSLAGATGADLFHVTPFPQRLPEGMCLTSFVHDPTPVILPSCHDPEAVRSFRHFIDYTVPRLKALMVPSQAVKNDLIRLFQIPDEKISVVYHGVDEAFFDAPPTATFLVRETYNLPDRYVLFVGSVEPRKNLKTLVRAYSSLREEVQKEHPLVIVGPRGWKHAPILKAIGNLPHVHVAGYVRPALMPALYQSASLFVMPSLYEGFGMPLLEAMAACVPIVASNWSAMPEVLGEAGLLVDPNSPHELATAIEKILDTPRLSTALGEAGRQRARHFTWEHTATETKAFFEKAMGK
jgi:glycosyltransferase involved in cell wall biosynthesis